MSMRTVPHLDESEERPNPVPTGFEGYESIGRLLEDYAGGWPNPERNDVVLLRALARLSYTRPEEAESGFSPTELAEMARELAGKTWAEGNDTTQIGRRVRKIWADLIRTWETKQEGIHQTIRDEGFLQTLLLDKIEGGGAGYPSRYRFAIQEGVETQEALAPELTHESPRSAASAGAVRYICEDVEDAGGLAAVLARGYPLKGWRALVFLMLIVGGWVLSVLISMGLASIPLGRATILQGLVFGFFLYLAWTSLWPVMSLGDSRITRAPWWLQSWNGWEDRLLELRRADGASYPVIKAVRYRGTCPSCSGGKVIVHTGGIEFFGRLVGRCNKSPREHVFSFDHVLRSGKALR